MALIQEVTWILIAKSFVFYLPNAKVFLLKFKDDEGKKSNVLVKLDNLSESFKSFYLTGQIGSRCCLRGIQKGNISIGKKSVQVFVARTKSTIQVLQENSYSTEADGFNYRGVVTNDEYAAHGAYVLDKRVRLLATSVYAISNCPVLKKGNVVQVFNGHFQKLAGEKVIFLCGRSYVQVNKDEEEPLLHRKFDTNLARKSGVVSLCQNYNLGAKDISELLKHYSEIVSHCGDHQLNLSELEPNEFENVVRTISPNAFGTTGTVVRSVVGEFILDDHKCNEDRPPVLPNFKSLESVEIVKERMSNGFKSHLKSLEKPLNFIQHVEPSSAPLLGTLKIDGTNGRLSVFSAQQGIPICFRETNNDRLDSKLDCPVVITKYESVVEYFKFGLEEIQYMYVKLCLNDVRVLPLKLLRRSSNSLQHSPPKMPKTSKDWKVLQSSGPVLLRKEETPVQIVRAKAPERSERMFVFKVEDYISSGAKIEILDVGDTIKIGTIGNMKRFSWNTVSELEAVKKFTIEHSDTLLDDGFDVSEVDKLNKSELCTLVGIIEERWLEDSWFNKETFRSPQQDFGIIGSKTIQLKLKSVNGPAVVQVFLSSWSRKQYPIGVLPGERVRVTCLETKVSEKGNKYFQSTFFTTLQVLSKEQEVGAWNASRTFLVDAELKITDTRLLTCIVTLENVVKLSLTALCLSCSSPLQNGRCSYVGCTAVGVTKFQYNLVAVVQVEDETASAHLFIQDEQIIQRLLQIPDDLWELLRYSARQSSNGEFVYLWNSHKERTDDFIAAHFRAWIQLSILTTYGRYICQCRRFKSKENFNSTVMRDFKLYCVDLHSVI